MTKAITNSYFNNFRGFSTEMKFLALATLINRAGAMVVPFLSKYLYEVLHFSYVQIGWVMVCFGLGSLAGTWLSGKLSDRIGFYKVMVISLFATGLIFILLQYITSYYIFCFSVFALTAIADMYRPAMLVGLDSYTTSDNKNSALSLIRSAVSLGFIFGALAGGFLILLLDYHYLFIVDGLTCIASAIVFFTFVKERKLPYKLKQFNHLSERTQILKDKPLLMHLFITMITGVLFFQIFTTLPLYYKEAFHLTSVEGSLFLVLNGALILFFEVPIVKYVEEKKINKLLIVSYGLLFMTISYSLLAFSHNIVFLILMMVFMSVGVMLTFPFSNSFVKNRSLKKQEGKFMSILTMSYCFAHIISTKSGMEIISTYGYTANWVFLAGIGFIGFLLAHTLVAMVEKEKKSKEEQITMSFFSKTGTSN